MKHLSQNCARSKCQRETQNAVTALTTVQ